MGNPLRFVLTAGQRHDSKPVPELLDGLGAKALLADKAYDSDKIVQDAEKRGMQDIIPSRINRKKQRVLDRHRYKARHLVDIYQSYNHLDGRTPLAVSQAAQLAHHGVSRFLLGSCVHICAALLGCMGCSLGQP